MREPRDALTDRRVTRALFAAMVFLVPMPFFMLFVDGWVPLACTIAWFLRPVLLLPFTDFGAAVAFAIIFALHVVVDGGLLYLGAVFVCEVLFWPGSTRRFAYVGVAVLVAAGIVASSFPIYRAMDGGVEAMNLPGVWRQFVLNQPRRGPLRATRRSS